MNHVHDYARHVTADGAGKIMYTCKIRECGHTVDWEAARDEYERTGVDLTAWCIKTPGGIGRFVSYDGASQMVTVEMDHEHLVEFPADQCCLPASCGGRRTA